MLFFELCDDESDECHERSECHEWECNECGENLLLNENYRVCPRCGLCSDSNFVQAFVDTPGYVKKSLYKQINHFKHILNTVQNKERATVPKEILESLEEHMEDLELNLENIRTTLKLMGQTKYYKHSVQIYCYLKGVTVFKCLTPAEEDKILSLFMKVQKAFKMLPDTKRKNFLNYNFLSSKLLVKVGREDLAQLCKPLKKTAMKGHNKIWGRMCEICYDLL